MITFLVAVYAFPGFQCVDVLSLVTKTLASLASIKVSEKRRRDSVLHSLRFSPLFQKGDWSEVFSG